MTHQPTHDDVRGSIRAGIRSTVARLGVLTRRAGHPSLLALICAGALAPVATVGAGAVAAALASALGGVGGGALTSVVMKALERLRRDGIEPETVEVATALSAQLDEILTGDTEDSAQLRADIGALFSRVDAAGNALQAAVQTGDEDLAALIASEFSDLGEQFSEFEFLLSDLNSAVKDMRHTLQRQETHRRDELRLGRRQSSQLQLILGNLRALRTGIRGDTNHPESSNQSPYLGLRPYMETDAELFFGRERATADLIAHVAFAASGRGIAVITGASGAGKSSLIHAGLLPAVARGDLGMAGSEMWPRARMRPGSDPLRELAACLAALTGKSALELRGTLAEAPDQAHLLAREAVLSSSAADDQARLLLVVDQFEELFTLAETDQREAFIEAVTAMADARGRRGAVIVIGLRGDFIDRCAAYPALADALDDHMFTTRPMTERDLREALTRPAHEAGLTLDSGLSDVILEELRGSDPATGYGAAALPLLSQTMHTLWKARVGDRLTRDAYRELGGVANAVQTIAEAVYSSLSESEQETARTMFKHLIVITKDGDLRRRVLTADQIAHLPSGRAVVEAFTAERLLVVSEEHVEIAHDTLLTSWQRLSEWTRDDRDSLALLGQLVVDADEWERQDRDDSFLYRGSRLRKIEHDRRHIWRENPQTFAPPGAVAMEFLGQARTAEARRRRVRRAVVTGLGSLLALAMTAALITVVSRSEAAEQRNRVASYEIAEASLAAGATDGELAKLLAATAWELSPTEEAEAALRASYDNVRDGIVATLPSEVQYLEFSPDGRHLVTIEQSGTITVWDAKTWTVADTLPFQAAISGSPGELIAFSRDSRLLAVHADLSPEVHLWDLDTGASAGSLELPDGDYLDGPLAVHPSGEVIAAVVSSLDIDGEEVRIFDVATGESIASYTAPDAVTALEFHRTEPTLLIGHRSWEDGIVFKIVEYESGEEIDAMALSGAPEHFAYSPDDAWLAVSVYGRTIFSPTASEAEESQLAIGMQPPLAFLPDGQSVAGRAGDQAIGFWDLETGARTGTLAFGDCSGEPCQVAMPLDGSSIVVADGTELLALDHERAFPTSAFATAWADTGSDRYGGARFDPDTGHLITADGGGIRSWETTFDGANIMPAGTPEQLDDQPHWGMEISPDGTRIAAANPDLPGVTVIDLRRPDESTIIETDGPVTALAFDDTSSRLAVATSVGENGRDPGFIQIWGLSTGEPTSDQTVETPSQVRSLSFANEPGLLMIGESLGFTTVDTKSGEVVTQRNIGMVTAVEYLNADNLAFVQAGHRIWTWDLGSDRWTSVTFADPGEEPLLGVFALSDSGDRLATVSGDQVIQIRDTVTFELLGTLDGFDVGYDLAFDSDGDRLVALGQEIRIWDLSFIDDPYRAVCERINRNLTEEEWSQHLPDLNYDNIDICT